MARLAMDQKRNPRNFREARAKACVGKVAGVSYMSAYEFGGLPDIQREGVAIPAQQCRHGLKIHSLEFCHQLCRSIGNSGSGKKSRDAVESDANKLANAILRGGGIIGDNGNLLFRSKKAACEIGEFLRRGEEAAAKVAFQKLPA